MRVSMCDTHVTCMWQPMWQPCDLKVPPSSPLFRSTMHLRGGTVSLPPSSERRLFCRLISFPSAPPPQSALKSKERKAAYAAQLLGQLATLNAEVQVLTDRAAELNTQGTSLTREVCEVAGQVRRRGLSEGRGAGSSKELTGKREGAGISAGVGLDTHGSRR